MRLACNICRAELGDVSFEDCCSQECARVQAIVLVLERILDRLEIAWPATG